METLIQDFFFFNNSEFFSGKTIKQSRVSKYIGDLGQL